MASYKNKYIGMKNLKRKATFLGGKGPQGVFFISYFSRFFLLYQGSLSSISEKMTQTRVRQLVRSKLEANFFLEGKQRGFLLSNMQNKKNKLRKRNKTKENAKNAQKLVEPVSSASQQQKVSNGSQQQRLSIQIIRPRQQCKLAAFVSSVSEFHDVYGIDH